VKKRSFGGILCLYAAASLVGCRGSGKFSDEAEKTAEQFKEKIRAEIKTLGNHAWAGEYCWGDGHREWVSLLLAPKAGFAFEWNGSLGLSDRNYGSVTIANGRIRLSLTFENNRKGFCEGLAEEFVPIPWGRRKYLVPSDDVIGFCNEVNGGMEPRYDIFDLGSYLLCKGDEKLRVAGFPSVSEEYRAYLLDKPILATIIALGSATTRQGRLAQCKDTNVILDAGKGKGLLTGMEMHVVKPPCLVVSARVTKVEERRSEAVVTQVGENDPAPRIGWQLSTRCWWRPEKGNVDRQKNTSPPEPAREGQGR
jgi:hypothetical protein